MLKLARSPRSIPATTIITATMGKTKKGKVYAVAAGRAPGIYSTWAECERQVKGFSGAKFKSFKTRDEAVAFVGGGSADGKRTAASSGGARDMKAASASSDQKRTMPANSTAASAAKRPRTAVSSIGGNGNDNKGTAAVVITVYFDGGARGNPGVAGAGAVITRQISEEDASRVVKARQYCGPNATNNVAEYTGLLVGLRTAKEFVEEYLAAIQETVTNAGDKNISLTATKMPSTIRDIQVDIRGDSDLIIKQMNGQYRCNNAGLIPLFDDCRSIASEIKMMEHSKLADGTKCRVSIDMSHVYRNDNKVADALANEAMDERRSWRTEFLRHAGGYEEELEDASGKGVVKKVALVV